MILRALFQVWGGEAPLNKLSGYRAEQVVISAKMIESQLHDFTIMYLEG